MPPTRATRYDGVYRSGRTTFKYVLDLDPDPSGKRRQESRGGYRSAEDAHKARTARLAELHRGVNTDPSKQLVSEYLESWVTVRAHRVRPSTVRQYRTNIATRIVPHIGSHPLPKLAPSHLRAWHAVLSKTHSPASVRQAHVILSMALNDAVDDGALPRNVARLVTPPQPEDADKRALTLEEVAAFLAVADQDDWSPLWRVALLTGLRRGELLALRWSDLDLDGGFLTVRNTVTTDAHGHIMIGPAKSKASQATIELDGSCVEALKRQRKRVAELHLAARYWTDDFVFPRTDGTPLAPSSVLERLRALCVTAGIPPITFHELRHTCASLLYSQGADVKLIQSRLRHARLSVTLETYTHLAAGQQRDAAERILKALDGITRQAGEHSG
jgi:integrase